MSDQIEELIREIAAKHGIAVARDDPILVLQTINLRLLKDSADAQKKQLDQFKEELEGVSMRWKADSTDKAERILNTALVASKSALNQVMQEQTQSIVGTIRSEIETSLESIAQQNRGAARNVLFNLVASSLTTIAVLITVFFLR